MRREVLLAVIATVVLSGVAQAAPITWTGYLNDPTNTALVGSDLGAPSFANDDEIVNNVALYTFALATDATVTFTSTGAAAGGAEPFFSLFAGTGGAATFVDSSVTAADIDFIVSRPLLAGSYTVAIGVWLNQSFADNSGGSLQDGFIGLGVPGLLGSSFYEVTATADESANPPVVPEPATIALLGSGLCALVARRRRSARAAVR